MRKLFFVFVALCCYSAAAQQTEPSLTTLSSSIADNLQYLKTESKNMVNQLQQYEIDLQQWQEVFERSEKERQAFASQSKKLSCSLMSINEQLNSCYTTMAVYETKLHQCMRVIVVLLTVLSIRLVLVAIGFVLYAKGIVLPRWVDILL